MNTGRTVPRGLLLTIAVLQPIFAGATFVFARYVLQRLDPFTVAFLRFCLSTIILGSIVCFMNRRPNIIPIEKRDWFSIISLGCIIIILNQVTYLYGQRFTTAVHGGLLFTLTPVVVYMMAIKILGEKWSKIRGLGISLAVFGAALIFFEKGLKLEKEMLKGDLIILFAVVVWAYYTVRGKPLVEKYGAFRVTAYALGAGSIVYFPFGLYRTLNADWSQMDTFGWISIGYIAIGTSVVAYSMWYWLLKYLDASQLAVLNNLQPIVAGLLGFILLGELATLPFVLAGAIILAGVTITQKAK